ncbi:MAG: methyltransferase domain-containing protein [Candidatus Omnitrophica bacterium]|nr:methyltransferase domain-containing protein [Candidatus Omnitrophota bacterium]
MQKIVRKLLRAVANYDPAYYDMHADPNEALFARLYVERITLHAARLGLRPPSTVLEAGCQAGRLVIPLAKLGFQVTGIDTSRFALRRAKAHANAAGVEARFVSGDFMDVLRVHPGWRYDMVVCAEVLYLARHYRTMLKALAGAVKPGGLLCVSHRPKCYYVVEALRHGDFEAAQQVLTAQEGQFDGPFPEAGYYNWQTEEELVELYRALGFSDITMYPIDRLAWLAGISPARLSRAEQERWLQLELACASDAPTSGRYALVIAATG